MFLRLYLAFSVASIKAQLSLLQTLVMENAYIIMFMKHIFLFGKMFNYLSWFLKFSQQKRQTPHPANILFGNSKEKWAIFSMMTFSCRSASYLFYEYPYQPLPTANGPTDPDRNPENPS